ncbi:hypothetical protein P9847_00190 [Paenibacillus chibensis]|uniref:O-antigen ligase domain-containing protein n=1 Tax=Paenibacillus chibensis TaxID=59846 RepID=A0ABU6PLI1_9BACL|nr:hypothetical protein [Paenibacillus chibensis]
MEMIFAMIYVLHQGISANLDLFYFLSIVLIVRDVIQRRELTLKAAGYVYFVVLYALLQIIVNDQIDLGRLAINLAKLFLNVMLFLQIRDMKMGMTSFKKIVYAGSAVNLLLLGIGVAHKTKLLWRLDDDVNLYQKVRLALFYAEPSEASFHVCILLLLLGAFAMREKRLKRNLPNLFFMLTNGIIVVMSAGMGGMMCLTLALLAMYVFYLCERLSIPKLLLTLLLSGLGTIAAVWFVASSNGFYQRLNDILNGTDGSVMYRLDISFRIMKQILIHSDFIGTGLGNLNTAAVQNAYYSQGLIGVIANSFMYVTAEGGAGAIVLLLAFHAMLFLRIQKHERVLKAGLLVFILAYQIAGGYFTNPVNWIVYGLIANHSLMRKQASYPSGGRLPAFSHDLSKIDPNVYSKRKTV